VLTSAPDILKKIETLKGEFASLPSREILYQKIMEWGKKLPHFDPLWKSEENRVLGCQSQMYLVSEVIEGKIYFYASSDALISAGLAALLIAIYSGQSAETILTTPPSYLEELGIPSALTPGRANGLASLHLKMKQEVITHLVK
jgi:cysteine desulfuration protein SufE